MYNIHVYTRESQSIAHTMSYQIVIITAAGKRISVAELQTLQVVFLFLFCCTTSLMTGDRDKVIAFCGGVSVTE